MATPSDPVAKELKRLKLSPEVGWYLTSRGYELPKHPPLHKTPDGGSRPDAAFDPDAVDRAINALAHMQHTKGTLAGQPLRPDAWQVAYILAPVFGWLRQNDNGRWVRVTRTCIIDLPRKNGKSTIAGGIALYLTGADGEQGAEVIAAATSREQAGFVFGPIKGLAQNSPALRGRFRPLVNKVLHPATNSEFKVVSAVADAQHGANLHGAIIDELHVHKRRDLVDAIETGTGSREQPLVLFLTTPDDGRPNTIYAVKRKMIESLARGALKDPTTYGVVFGLPDRANPLNPINWPKANPGYPISPTHDYLESAAAKAKQGPAELALFKRLHAGQRTRQTTTYIDLKKWDSNATKTRDKVEAFKGLPAFGGLDLGSVSDLSALCWLVPEGTGYRAMWRFWAPEAALPALDRATAESASREWVPQGWLTLTPGDVTDYDFIKAAILSDAQLLDVQSIGLDMWNATQLANDLSAEGLPLMKVRQGYITMNPAMQEMKRRVLRRELRHDGNPVQRWCVDNLAITMDPAGNVKPDKAKSAEKIDGVAALANALSEAINTARTTSAYDDGHDLLII
ncbi:MAG: terminase large subunit [Propionibacteriaceae bacterium]|nr:terminase large subunit [Propionibacteriaceae bacterium]